MEIIKREPSQDVLNAIDFINRNGMLISDLERDFLSRRFKDASSFSKFVEVFLKNSFPEIDSPFNLIGMDTAVTRLLNAIEADEKIVIACDYDADGLGATSVLTLGLLALGAKKENVQSIISNRYKGGYGFNDSVVDEILKTDARVVVTVDEGSSDEDRIARLVKDSGIDVIVTDHHHVPPTPPVSALSFINPNQPGDTFKHKDICGAVVAFMLVKGMNERSCKGIDMKLLMDICAISTVGDVMPLNDGLNRAIVAFGLKRANSDRARAFWCAVRSEQEVIDASTIGFSIAPKINAMSRIGADPQAVIDFLTTDDDAIARDAYAKMSACNEERKEVSESLYESSITQIKDCFANVIYLEEGVSGVTGIVASRIKEETGKPVICFCPKQDSEGWITGSGRSVGGIDIREAVESISDDFDIFFGGHPMACGVSLRLEDLPRFTEVFEREIERQAKGIMPKPFVEYDFEIPLSLGLLRELDRFQPLGHMLPPVCVKITGEVSFFRRLDKGHLMGTIETTSGQVKFIWFAGKISSALKGLELYTGNSVTLYGVPVINSFKGKDNIQILVDVIKV